MPPDEYGAFGEDDEPADNGLPGAQQPPYTVVQTKSKWSIFTSPHESDEASYIIDFVIIAITHVLGGR